MGWNGERNFLLSIGVATVGALAALAACGNPDFARRMAACEDRGAEVLAGVVMNPREEAITRCARSVDAFGVIDQP
jgi:hypothetical protein